MSAVVHLGDCLDVMRGMEANSVDLICTDLAQPPIKLTVAFRAERDKVVHCVIARGRVTVNVMALDKLRRVFLVEVATADALSPATLAHKAVTSINCQPDLLPIVSPVALFQIASASPVSRILSAFHPQLVCRIKTSASAVFLPLSSSPDKRRPALRAKARRTVAGIMPLNSACFDSVPSTSRITKTLGSICRCKYLGALFASTRIVQQKLVVFSQRHCKFNQPPLDPVMIASDAVPNLSKGQTLHNIQGLQIFVFGHTSILSQKGGTL